MEGLSRHHLQIQLYIAVSQDPSPIESTYVVPGRCHKAADNFPGVGIL